MADPQKIESYGCHHFKYEKVVDMGFTSPYVPMIYFEKNDGWLEDIQDTD